MRLVFARDFAAGFDRAPLVFDELDRFRVELDLARDEPPRFDPPDALLRCSAISDQTIDA